MPAKTEEFTAFTERAIAEIDRHLNQLLTLPHPTNASLYEAARYSLFSGGKRLRPLLTLATAEALAIPIDHVLQPACALELIHTYSMIHDDLPCMDDDDFRRGKPTLHRLYPEGHAVLAGDFLLTYAFEVLATSPFLNNEQRARLVVCLAQAAGGQGMVGGQALDLQATQQTVDASYLKAMHRAKTAALFGAALEMGAIAAAVSDKITNQLRHVGLQLGLAFQILDDILDVEASEAKHGKAVGSDAVNKKNTYVSLFGLDVAKDRAKQLIDLTLNDLAQATSHFCGNSAPLHALIAQLHYLPLNQ